MCSDFSFTTVLDKSLVLQFFCCLDIKTTCVIMGVICMLDLMGSRDRPIDQSSVCTQPSNHHHNYPNLDLPLDDCIRLDHSEKESVLSYNHFLYKDYFDHLLNTVYYTKYFTVKKVELYLD